MEKRGQLEQLFVYIFALIVAAFIIGFGYYMITNLLNLGKDVETAKFKQDIQKQIGIYYSYAPNTNGNIKIRTPSGIKAICFIGGGDTSNIIYEDIKEEIKIASDKNVFFETTKKDVIAEPVYVDKFKPSPDPLCINTLNGVLDIDLTTSGDHVEISEHKA